MKFLFIPLLILLAGFPFWASAQTDTWLETNNGIGNIAAGDRFEVAEILTLQNGRTFACVEAHSGGESQNGVYELNQSTWTWTRIAPQANGYGFSQVISDANRIFEIRQNVVRELDLNTNEWSQILEIPDIGIPNSASVSIVGDSLFFRSRLEGSNLTENRQRDPNANFQENEEFITAVNLNDGNYTLLRNPSKPLIIPSRGGNSNMSLALATGKKYIHNTFDLRSKDGYGGLYEWTGSGWISASAGLNAINITGSGFGPTGPIYTDVNKQKLFVRTEQGFYEKAEGGWIKYFYRTGSRFFISPDYLFINNNNGSFFRVDRALKTFMPRNGISCVESVRQFMTPNNGGFFLAEIEVQTDDLGNCSDSNDDEKRLGIYRYAPNYNKPGTVSNLHLDVGTYLGGVGENKVGQTLILPSGKVLIGGTFNDNMGTTPSTLLSTTESSKGKLFVMSADGTTVEQSIILGEEIKDMDINASGEIALTGDFGVAVLNADYSLKWSASESISKGRIAIADDGKVVALLASASNGAGIIKLFANDGSEIHTNTSIDNNGVHINDVEISSAAAHNQYYVAGFTQASSVLQVAYIYAYPLTASTTRNWKTWGFGASEINTNENGADTRAYRIKATADKLFIAGESAGGGPGGFSIFAYNGKDLSTKVANNGNDFFTDGTNSCGSCHITFLGRVDVSTGEVERGKFFHGRLSGGKTNTHKVDKGDLEIDDQGNVLLVGISAFQIQDRDVFNINGQLVGSYAGGDQYILMTTPDFQTRIIWGVFSKERGSGDDNRIAYGNGKVAYIATSTKGTLMTTENALKAEPYNTIQEDYQLSQSDVYFALWDRDVWETANLDEIQRPFIPADSCFRVDNLPCRTEDPTGTSLIDLIKPFNILTPNGDNRNDTWLVSNLNLAESHKIRVFTKNGQVVFETNNYDQNWNGSYNGQPLPAGVYYYTIYVNNEKKPKTGYITIIY